VTAVPETPTTVQLGDSGETGARYESALDAGFPTTIAEYAAGLRERAFSCFELTTNILAAASSSQQAINAFIAITDEPALRQARRVDRLLASRRDLGPLMGVPIGIKDVFDVAGVPTTAGSRLFAGNVADADAHAVGRLVRRGAVVVGKTNMDMFCIGPHQDDFGRTNCPADTTRYAGGSSCGSAAAVALGLVLASLGTDAGGSSRFPAACCGVVALKPTFGRLATTGVFPTFPSLDHVAPFAATVDDIRYVFSALADAPSRPALRLGSAPRIGVLDNWEQGCSEVVARAVGDALVAVARAGGQIVEGRKIAGHDKALGRLVSIVAPEALEALDPVLLDGRAVVPAALREQVEAARSWPRENYSEAQRSRKRFEAALDKALTDLDVVATPTTGIEALRWSDLDNLGMGVVERSSRFLPLANLTGYPAISVPVPSPGLPVGLQLIARRDQDELLIDIAAWVERNVMEVATSPERR
jgi:Asp-tRNA(Asn)/Glu-tRNA(Gln) amidotransferase A subunit family amidase